MAATMMTNSLHQTPVVGLAASGLRRSAFTGTRAPFAAPCVCRPSKASTFTPQALFTRNKQEDKVSLSIHMPVPFDSPPHLAWKFSAQ